MLVPGLILLLCAGLKFSQADYECLCSYAADTPIYVSMDISSNIIGHMHEFSCKQKVSLSQNGWTAILVNHKIGYVKLTGRMVTQMCQGTPEVVPTTTVTTIVPTTSSTTLAPSSSTPSLKTTTAPSVSTPSPTVSVQTSVPSVKTTNPVLFTHKPNSTSTTIHTSSMISTASSNISTSALSSSATPKQFTSTAGSTTQTTTPANSMSKAQTTAIPTTKAPTTKTPTTAIPTTKVPTTKAPTTAIPTTKVPTTKAPTTAIPTTKAPLTTASTTKATTTKATTKAPFNIFSGLHTCPANVVAAAKHNNGFVQVHAGSCYELVPYWFTWQSAEKNCVSKGGHLVHISNQDEENFILNFLYRHGFDQAVWTGLNDRHHEEYFTWTSGVRFSWQNWMPGRKSNFYNHIYEDCVVYVPYTNYAHWDDVDCRQTHPWICRYDGTSGSQTTTLAPIINFLSNLLIGRDVK